MSHEVDHEVLTLYSQRGIDPATATGWARALHRRRERFSRAGIAYQTFVVPEAPSVHRDRLPEGSDGRAPFEQLSRRLSEQDLARCVYPVEALVSGEARRETFSADGQWSGWGAWLGYRASVTALAAEVGGIRILDDMDLIWSERPASQRPDGHDPEGDPFEATATVLRPRSRLTSRVTTEDGETMLVMEQDDTSLPTAVIFRDSCMDAAARFYSESFRRTVFVSTPNTVFWDLVEAERPTVVIHELAERRLVLAPAEPSTRDFRAVLGDLVLEDTDAVADERRSRSLARAGRTEEALEASNQVLARVRPTARVMVHRARLHLAAGRREAAIEALRHATVLDPADGGAWSALGRLLLEAPGRWRQATAAHTRAAHAEPDQPAYWQAAMSAAVRADDLELADGLRGAAVALHPDDGEVAHAASWVLAATGRLEEAEQAAALATRDQPSSVDRLWQLAAVQIRRGRVDEAERTVTQIAEIQPDDPNVRHYRDVLEQARASRTATTEGNHEGQR